MAAGSRRPVAMNWSERRGRRQLPVHAGLEPARREALGRSAPASANTVVCREQPRRRAAAALGATPTQCHRAVRARAAPSERACPARVVMATGETSELAQAVHHEAGGLLAHQQTTTDGDSKFWTAAAAAATFFEDTPEEAVKRHVAALRRRFHHGRHLLIKYLPRDVTEQVGAHFFAFLHAQVFGMPDIPVKIVWQCARSIVKYKRSVSTPWGAD
jgi:hypothetical protein